MLKKIALLLLVSGISIGLSGCRTPEMKNQPGAGQSEVSAGAVTPDTRQQDKNATAASLVVVCPVESPVNRTLDSRVEINGKLSEQMEISDIGEKVTNDGYRRVQVTVRNLSQSSFKIIYRFDWYDADGMRVDNPDHEGWERRYLMREDDLILSSMAPSRKCQDFKLHFRGR